MEQKPILVIMAAGMGRRFGGLKQMTPIDGHGHSIIDYSIYDAIQAGFSRVICILKPELEADFRAGFGDRIAEHVTLEYAFQSLDMLPAGFSVPDGREKPWGTAHAVLCAKDLIDAPFAVINADDFYGRAAIASIYDFLATPQAAASHAMVGYRIERALSPSGSVSRGVCEVDADGYLRAIVERTHIEHSIQRIHYVENGARTIIPEGTTVSMNLWGFQPSILSEIEARFVTFLTENLPARPLACEYYLPEVPNQLLHEGLATVRVLATAEQWYGVTYAEDKDTILTALTALREAGVYPPALWQ